MVINYYCSFILSLNLGKVNIKITKFRKFSILHIFWGDILYISADIAARVKEIAKKQGVSIGDMMNALNLGKNTLTNFKSSMPKADNLAKIADYLDCSVDYLLGRTTEIKKTAEPDEKAQQLLNIFYSFNDEGRIKLLEQALMMQSFGAYNATSDIVKVAARSGNPDDVEIVDIDSLQDAPDTI